MKKLGLAIPSWNRDDLTINSFSRIIDDERIEMVTIVDDDSDRDIYESLKKKVDNHPKIKLHRNIKNKGCYVNKMMAVALSESKYVALIDSDNTFDKQYLDSICAQKWSPARILAPVYARPAFDYRSFTNKIIDKRNLYEYIDQPHFLTALNTMNFFIYRDLFLETWDESVEPMTADSVYFNYLWLNKGLSIFFPEGMEYDHLVHSGSHYQKFNHLTGSFYTETIEKLRQLR